MVILLLAFYHKNFAKSMLIFVQHKGFRVQYPEAFAVYINGFRKEHCWFVRGLFPVHRFDGYAESYIQVAVAAAQLVDEALFIGILFHRDVVAELIE